MRVLVCGGRLYGIGDVRKRLHQFHVLSALHEKHWFTAIIEGGAPGADAGAAAFGKQRDIPVLTFKADWDRRGAAAGPLRNQRMIDEGKPNLVVAFPGGRGTADMIRRAEEAGVRVIRTWEEPPATPPAPPTASPA